MEFDEVEFDAFEFEDDIALKKYVNDEQTRILSLAFKRLFEGEDSEVVLDNLANFCRANSTSYVPGDPYATAFCEGRREVYLHIMKYISMGVD